MSKRSSFQSVVFAVLSLASLLVGCAAAPDDPSDPPSVAVSDGPITVQEKSIGRHVKLSFGDFADAIERFECSKLDLTKETLTFPDGCTVTVQNRDCRTVQGADGSYYCTCDVVATSADGCGGWEP